MTEQSVIPMGLCQCGCGQPAPIAKTTRSERGQFRGDPIRFISGHNAKVRIATQETREKLRRARLGKKMTLKMEPGVRFAQYVTRADGVQCWVWIGKINNKGYGMFSIRGKHVLAHRFSYECHKGVIPSGLVLDHLCSNPACVNPAHLEAITQAENLRRGRGFAGVNARKSECDFGHPYTPETTILTAQGWRDCRICRARREKGRVRDRRSTTTNKEASHEI